MTDQFDPAETPDIEITFLPKEQWKGTEIPLTTRNDSYYDVEIRPLDYDGCTVSLVRKTAEKEIVHKPGRYNNVRPLPVHLKPAVFARTSRTEDYSLPIPKYSL